MTRARSRSRVRARAARDHHCRIAWIACTAWTWLHRPPARPRSTGLPGRRRQGTSPRAHLPERPLPCPGHLGGVLRHATDRGDTAGATGTDFSPAARSRRAADSPPTHRTPPAGDRRPTADARPRTVGENPPGRGLTSTARCGHGSHGARRPRSGLARLRRPPSSLTPRAGRPPCPSGPRHSHSIVAGGLLVTSRTTRLTSGTSLVMRPEMRAMTSWSSRDQSAVMASSLLTGRSTIGCP